MCMLRMMSVEQKTIELLALVKLRAIIIQTILRKMRSMIGIIVEQGDGAESMISDDYFRVEIILLNINVIVNELMLSKIMHVSQNMGRMNVDKHHVGIMIQKFEQM